MASIKQRGKTYSVIYKGLKNGKYTQIWGTYKTKEEAVARKNELELSKNNDTYQLSKTLKVSDIINDYVGAYGKTHWSPDTYSDKMGRINNYILPNIGEMLAWDITPSMIDDYYSALTKMKAKPGNGHKPKKQALVSPRIVKECHTILSGAFDLAARYKKVSDNPCKRAILPSVEGSKERTVWNIETFKTVIASDKVDDLMYNIMNLGVTATARIGEITGLQWKNTHIEDNLINENRAYIEIVTELNRFDKESIAIAKTKKITLVFPNLKEDSKTVTVLTEPKTQKSCRKVFIPRTMALSLKKWKEKQDQIKLFKGNEYQDYDLVFCQENGRPIECRLINKKLKKICKEHNLPLITSHSFRHLGATIKLEITHGNIKAVQADTGHSQSKTLLDIYAHTYNEERIKNSRKLEQTLYSDDRDELNHILEKIKANPALLHSIREMID